VQAEASNRRVKKKTSHHRARRKERPFEHFTGLYNGATPKELQTRKKSRQNKKRVLGVCTEGVSGVFLQGLTATMDGEDFDRRGRERDACWGGIFPR